MSNDGLISFGTEDEIKILTEFSTPGVKCSKNIILSCQEHLFGGLQMCIEMGKAHLPDILLPPVRKKGYAFNAFQFQLLPHESFIRF